MTVARRAWWRRTWRVAYFTADGVRHGIAPGVYRLRCTAERERNAYAAIDGLLSPLVWTVERDTP